MKYVADDGTVFSTAAECLSYEKNPYNSLEKFINLNITKSYNDDAGFSIIEESGVLKFIVDNLDEINKIMKMNEQPSTTDGCISNIGRNICWHPESLSADTKVEVKTRRGNKYSGIASDWSLSWKEVGGLQGAIVAYRILKD